MALNKRHKVNVVLILTGNLMLEVEFVVLQKFRQLSVELSLIQRLDSEIEIVL